MGIEGLTYAGNHGLEILHPDGSRFVHPMPKEYEEKSAVLLKQLQEQVNIIINIMFQKVLNIKLYVLGLQKWCMGRE